MNSAGAGPFSNALAVRDEVVMGITLIPNPYFDQDVPSLDNSLGTEPLAVTVVIDAWNSEHWDTSVTPDAQIWDSFNANQVANVGSFAFANHTRMIITFEVPAGEDWSGYYLRIYGLADSSGNVMGPADFLYKNML